MNLSCSLGQSSSQVRRRIPNVTLSIEVGRCRYFIDDILIEDDPGLTAAQRRRLAPGRGGSGITAPTRNATGTWVVRRDFVLGAGIEDYPEPDQ